MESNIAAFYERENPSVVVTVDCDDNSIGVMDKLQAHEDGGTLHRAFSVFVFDDRGRLLLQRRAKSKYHFGNLWTNTCCGHAVPGEEIGVTAPIRLWQEMGICTNLTEVRSFLYEAKDSVTLLTEREIDHVYVGITTDVPSANPNEVDSWRWATLREVDEELSVSPETFTPWFPLAYNALSK